MRSALLAGLTGAVLLSGCVGGNEDELNTGFESVIGDGLNQLRANEQARLGSYKKVDEKTFQIPIERAMELVAQKPAYQSSANTGRVKKQAAADAKPFEIGAAIYKTNCVACHKPDGGGLVGPNLTDEFWVHGGSLEKVIGTITEGVPAKGMIAWKAQLKPKEIEAVARYIKSLKGTNPAGAKAQEGEKYTGDDGDLNVWSGGGGGGDAAPALSPELAAGKKTYDTSCVACHAPDGGGTVGPNLTDDFWIHGGSLDEVVKTITDGVPAKGMIAWKAMLKPEQILAVAKYIKSLRGTTPATPKAAEGKKYEEPAAPEGDKPAPEGEKAPPAK